MELNSKQGLGYFRLTWTAEVDYDKASGDHLLFETPTSHLVITLLIVSLLARGQRLKPTPRGNMFIFSCTLTLFFTRAQIAVCRGTMGRPTE